MQAKLDKPHIVIVGANFSGLSAASKLDQHLNVSVIDSKTHFQWTPNIHEILSDVKQTDAVQLCLRTICERLGQRFINKFVTGLNTKEQTISFDDDSQIHYDVLLIASGHTRENYGVVGAAEHALSFRNTDDVEKIKTKLEQLLGESSKPLHLNIVGAGYTGIEVMGELLRKYPNNSQLKLNIIDQAARVLPLLPEKLAFDVQDQLSKQNVRMLMTHHIAAIDSANIHFSDQTIMPSDITIWTAGTALPAYIQNSSLSLQRNGIKVNEYLQTSNEDNIFVAGDAASLDKPLAKQASIAMDLGEHVGRNINAYCKGSALSRVSIGDKPILLTLGNINTYFIYQNLVLASPTLASAKEAVYQLYMAKLSNMLPMEQKISGIFSRLLSTEKLILAEILKCRPREILAKSRIL